MTSDPRVGGRPAGAGSQEESAGDCRGSRPAGERLVLGCWNMSHWTAAKARTVFEELGVDVLALQETHLAALPLQWAHGTVRQVGWHLLHGHPVPPVPGGTYGKSCGVGFVLRSGVAAAAVPPVGAAWRWLHLAGRLHGIRLAPRAGLPHGLLLLSAYAPLQTKQQHVERTKFVAALQEVSHGLDLQVPTLLMGDFNGSAFPGRDFHGTTSARRAACPLLADLLGPGGAWVDVHAAMLPEPLPWTFQLLDRDGNLSASRIDLVLANHAAMALVRGAKVLTDVRDGGHSPVLVELVYQGPVAVNWQRPRPRLPDLLAGAALLCSMGGPFGAVESIIGRPAGAEPATTAYDVQPLHCIVWGTAASGDLSRRLGHAPCGSATSI
jgi:exonuclease III